MNIKMRHKKRWMIKLIRIKISNHWLNEVKFASEIKGPQQKRREKEKALSFKINTIAQETFEEFKRSLFINDNKGQVIIIIPKVINKEYFSGKATTSDNSTLLDKKTETYIDQIYESKWNKCLM